MRHASRSAITVIKPQPSERTTEPEADSVVLSDDQNYQTQLIIERNNSEAKFLVKTYRKRRETLELILERSLGLDENGAMRLLGALRSSLMADGSGASEKYFIMKSNQDGSVATETDPNRIVEALLALLDDRRIAKHFARQEIGMALRESLTGAIRISEVRSALALLRHYLDTGVADEKEYQKWCEQHTWAFGNAYVMKDSVRRISIGDTLDLLLPTVLTGYREIIELKRPDMDILRYDENHKNYYFSPDASRAVGQCHRYIDTLHEVAANGLKDHADIVAYHPRAVIVMGRSADWVPEKIRALHVLNRGMHHVTIMTYDHLLAQGERAVQIVDYNREGFSPLDVEEAESRPTMPPVTIAEHLSV